MLIPSRLDQACVLVQGFQTLSADLDRHQAATAKHFSLLDVRPELAFGAHFGMTYIVSELRPFAANLAFGHWISPNLSQGVITLRVREYLTARRITRRSQGKR